MYPKLKNIIITLLVSYGFSIVAANAQSVQLLGDFKDWSAYSASTGNAKLCFVLSKPKNISPKPENYQQSYIYLTHRPNENIRAEFNFIAGSKFAPETMAKIIIGAKSYELFTKDDAAWLANRELGKELAGQMRAGASMKIIATTSDNVEITQTFSLSGVTAASRAIDRACN